MARVPGAPSGQGKAAALKAWLGSRLRPGGAFRDYPDALVLVGYCFGSAVAQIAAGAVGRQVPGMNFGQPLWRNFLAYDAGAPLVGYLLWRQNSRARLGAYTFLTVDIIRSLRYGHWIALSLDLLVLFYLQTPRMRRVYPTVRSREVIRRLKARLGGIRQLILP